MMLSSTLLLSLTATIAMAQSSTITTSPTLPTATAQAASYNGMYRPQIHFSPPQGFMNDPNGMFLDANGTYHLYYQLNPNQTIAGFQHWGHATSEDLYHWTNQKIALSPTDITEGIFTGSAVVDVNNTSGFFRNQTNGVVAIYTFNTPTEQTQDIAYSLDNGFTFVKYSGNPVISIGSANFRDPKVIWHAPTSNWIMVVSHAQEYTIEIFTSPNLTTWTPASNFSQHGMLGLQWECPNLVEIPMVNATEPMYLMYISINPGSLLGGSITQYYPGAFNGTHFTPVDNAARFADFGKDNYAGQFFFGIPGTQNQISIDWASNWEYCNYVPTGPEEGWQSAMSLPRVNYLKNISRVGYDLVSEPYDLSPVMGAQIAANDSLGNGTLLVDLGEGTGASLFEVNITSLNTTLLSNTAFVNFTLLSSVSGETLTGGIALAETAMFWLNRGNARGFDNPFFTDKFSKGLLLEDGFNMRVVVDRSIWEVFLMGGESSATLSYFPEYPMDTLIVRAGDLNSDAVVHVAVWELTSAWAAEGNSSGMVGGNRTMAVRRDILLESMCVAR